MQYCDKLAAHSDNLTYDIDFELENTFKESISNIPPWTHAPPKINFDFVKRRKSETTGDVFLSNLNEIIEKFPSYHCIYTDGLKTLVHIGCQKHTIEVIQYFQQN